MRKLGSSESVILAHANCPRKRYGLRVMGQFDARQDLACYKAAGGFEFWHCRSDCGTRNLRVIHGWDACATFQNCTST